MNTSWVAVRAGVRRGWIELKHTFTTPNDLVTQLVFTAILLTVMLWTRTTTVPGTRFSLGTAMLASMIGMNVGFNGMATLGGILTIEREDGTLLRAKAVPNGMLGYLVGKITLVAGMSVVGLAIGLIPGLILFDGLATGGVSSWVTLAWVLVLGLLATMPLGAIFGSLFSNPRNVGMIMLPVMGLIATSGIFYPITTFPHWMQWVAQSFPVYWMGLGMRSALLPDALASVEIGHSWRHLETVGVLGAWALVGLVVAPIVLRRMARRESGSSVAARREKAMQRAT
jgi:ABC-2 type transport system permease protein